MHQKPEPLFTAGSAEAYLDLVRENRDRLADNGATAEDNSDVFFIRGYCVPCEREVDFRVDYLAGGSRATGPNWRERLVCPGCHMSNRQRLVTALVQLELNQSRSARRLYLMEQITPVTRFLAMNQPHHEVIGSEYFGPDFEPGQRIWPWHYQRPLDTRQSFRSLVVSARFAVRMLRGGGIRHEDIGKLSFANASIDLMVSNDVFEHVPDPTQAFAECLRVLKPGGKLVATFPFFSQLEASRVRARLAGEVLEHILPPEYHGDPTSSKGALVFTEFGRDIFTLFREAGFSDVQLQVYHNPALGHPGVSPVFVLTK